MTSRAARADFFDASALAKVYSVETGSDIVRAYFQARSTKYTTPFCFYETMNVLKGKWKYKAQLTQEQYLDAASRLAAWYGTSSSKIKDLDFADPTILFEAKVLSLRCGLDLSDAFQILSVKKGYFSVLANDSSTILVTADKALAEAAESEGVRAWNVMSKPAPQ